MSRQEQHELSEFNRIEDDNNSYSTPRNQSPNDSFNEKQPVSPDAPDKEGTLRSEPTPAAEMLAVPAQTIDPDASEARSSITVSEVGSGYNRDENECTEFCMDFLSCFGLFDTCCPANGEGYLTTAATFCGNILVGCCKCK